LPRSLLYGSGSLLGTTCVCFVSYSDTLAPANPCRCSSEPCPMPHSALRMPCGVGGCFLCECASFPFVCSLAHLVRRAALGLKCSATWRLAVPCMRALWLWASLRFTCLARLSRRAGRGFKVADIEDLGPAAAARGFFCDKLRDFFATSKNSGFLELRPQSESSCGSERQEREDKKWRRLRESNPCTSRERAVS